MYVPHTFSSYLMYLRIIAILFPLLESAYLHVRTYFRLFQQTKFTKTEYARSARHFASMYQYSYDSSESSDSETRDSLNPIKTLDFSESFRTSQDAAEQLENLSKSSEERDKPVERLFLLQNNLTIVPDNVSKFMRLKTLDLSNNYISSLPNSILQLPLNALIVKNNRLTDSGIPKSLKQLRTLKVCNLSGNSLTKFPQQLAEIRSLEYLYLGNNAIVELPKEIETLQR